MTTMDGGDVPSSFAHHSRRGHDDWLAQLRVAQPVVLITALTVSALLSHRSTPSPRRRRSLVLRLSGLALNFTYFTSALLLILRAVIPSDQQVWTPELPLWRNFDWQIILNIIAISGTFLLLAWKERQSGPGRYPVQPIYAACAFGGIGDVLTFVLYVVAKSERHDWQRTTPWTWAQLALQIFRIIFLWPILTVVASVSASPESLREEDAQDGRDDQLSQNTASASASVEGTTERTSLLRPTSSAGNSASHQYGTTSAGPSTNGHTTPTAPSKAKSGAAAANASMGLSVSTQPPPPTFRVFFQRIVLLFPYLWPSQSITLQALAVFCVFLLLIGRVVNLAVPLILGRIVDKLSGKDSAASLNIWWLIAGYAGLRCLQGNGGALQVLQNIAWLPLQQYSDRHMSLMAFRHLLDLSMAFHTKRKTGEVLRILDRGSSINSFFQYLIFSIGPIFFDIVIATAFLSLTFGPQVGVLLFAVMALYTAVSVKLTTWRTALRREANNRDSVSRAIHTDVLLNYESVKVYNNENYETERYRLSLLDYQKADWKVNASLNVLNLIQNLILSIGTLLMLLVVAYDVVHGYASSSDFVVFISYLGQIYGPLNMLSTLYRVIQTSLVDTDKLIALLQQEKDVKDIPGAKDLEIREGVLEFRDVKFSYDGKVEALKGLSFTINPKSKVALVGETGSGKSTVLRLLYRFYDPTSGSILIDGQDIRNVTQGSLRKAIGVVPQEAGLLNTSIKTNIAYGRTEPEATDEEIEAAAAAAQILDKIKTFPEGMDTVVGERGVRLSGGEKQRVAISRCFLKSPPILLLDEATSALDSQTERQIQTALATLLEGKTSLTIAHRLSTIVNSDQILVLHDGRVVESGSHEELIEIPGGRYAAMWKAQVETDNERIEKELREKDARGKERAIDIPAPAEVEAELVPQPGMLGVLSSSQVDAATDQQSRPIQGGEGVADTAAADVPADASFHIPETADPPQSEEALLLDTVQEVSQEVSPAPTIARESKASGNDDPADPAPLAFPATRDAGADGAAGLQAQATTITTSASKVDASLGVPGDVSLSATPPVGSPAGSHSGASTPGKIRRRLTSLIKRGSSGAATPTGNEGSGEVPGEASPVSLRRSVSTRSAAGIGPGPFGTAVGTESLSRSNSFKSAGRATSVADESNPKSRAASTSTEPGKLALASPAGTAGVGSSAERNTSPKPPSTSGSGNLSSKKKKKKDKKKK